LAEAQSAIKRPNAKTERIAPAPIDQPRSDVVRGPHRRNLLTASRSLKLGMPWTIPSLLPHNEPMLANMRGHVQLPRTSLPQLALLRHADCIKQCPGSG
jgi:hypothetical protein